MKNRKQKIKNLILLGILILLINAINSLALPVPRGVDGIIYDLEGNQISGAFFSVNDTVTGQFTQGITGSYGSPGRYSVSINGEDSDLIIIRAWNQYHNTSMQVLLEGVMHKINLYLNTTMPNNAPEIISTPVTQAIANYNYTYDVDAYDPDLDTLSYSLLLYPVGMTINETSGLIEWVPTIAQAGNHTVIVMVTDNQFNDTQGFSINVSITNNAPVINSTPVTVASPGFDYYYDVDAYDPDLDTLSYSLVTQPTGMRINQSTGLIHWIPTIDQAGDHTVIVKVSDGDLNDTQGFSINVSSINHAPYINSTPVTVARPFRIYIYRVKAYDPDDDTLTYYLLEKPRGMRILRSIGIVFWWPRHSQIGNHTVIVMVTDGKLNDIQEYIVNVDYKNYQFGGNTNLYSTSIGPDLSKNLNPIISKINVPFKISGTIFKLPEIQARAGTSVKIENLNSNEVIETKTGLGPNSGAFYSLVYGDENDLIRITVGKKELFTKLKDTNIDIILNKSTFSYITSFLSLIIKSNYAIIFAIILLPVLLLCKVKKHFKEIKKNKEK